MAIFLVSMLDFWGVPGALGKKSLGSGPPVREAGWTSNSTASDQPHKLRGKKPSFQRRTSHGSQRSLGIHIWLDSLIVCILVHMHIWHFFWIPVKNEIGRSWRGGWPCIYMMYIYVLYILLCMLPIKGTNGDATLIIGKNPLSKPKNYAGN